MGSPVGASHLNTFLGLIQLRGGPFWHQRWAAAPLEVPSLAPGYDW